LSSNDSTDRSTQANADRLDSDYLKAKQQILLLKADQQDLGEFLRPKHPKMIALTEEIARRERLLDIFRKQNAEQLESRKGSLSLQIQNLEKDVKEWDFKTLAINRQMAESQRLKGNSQRLQALYDKLLATMQTLDVNKEISPESVIIMEKASPAVQDRPPLSKKLLLGGLVGAAFAVLLLLFLDRLDDRMNSFTELQDLFDETVLGQIPREKAKSVGGALGLMKPEDTRHAFVEAYRNLRSSLLFMNETGQRPRTLLITSSVPSEGKSLTSSNLAIAIANTGSKVLLVDADLRKGVLHTRFGVSPEPGLSEALIQGLNWVEAVRPTKIPNLSILPRGAYTQNSSELFITEVARKFLTETSGGYDYVIMDTAPVMAADDVSSLAPHLDGVLFVLRAEYTSARVARAALELLYQRNVRVLGLVFNAVRPSSGDYYYYHKYKDYYHSYPTAPATKA
jgi:capsular exopolysaccharide synthesis family protein